MLKSILKLTVLMEVNEVQRVRSTLSHTPDRLQVLLIRVVVLGQRRVQVVPAKVSGQEKNSVVSPLQMTFAAGTVRCKVVGRKSEGEIIIYSETHMP